ncbi:MAG: hypothetical protein GX793_06490 [Bacteroidales bacterium]|nr:hypothetical protein [Bacteroidales bacterium]
MKSIKFIVLIGVLFIFYINFSCNNNAKSTNNVENDITNNENVFKIDYPKDSSLDQISSLLAGDCAKNFETIFTDEMVFWNEFKNSVDNSWAKIIEERLSKMDVWSETEINSKINDTILLFYPFSGPDFLNAYHLFPNANEYILVAMEKIGSLPNLYEMNEADINDYLEAVNFSLRDIFKRSYFITGNMNSDLRKNKTDGVLPLLFVFLNRTNHEIFEYGYYRLEDDGQTFTKIDAPTNSLENIECVKIKILKKGDNKLKDLTYFYADITDDGFDKTSPFYSYLDSLRACNVFIKSASYLSHYSTFSKIRNLVLNKSKAVLEDDTGVPFRFFKDDFDFYLYGEYEKPIADFNSTGLFQKDLNDAYVNVGAKELDFSLGYHWHSTKQNWLLFVKKDKSLVN